MSNRSNVMMHAAKDVICAMQPILQGNKSAENFYKAIVMIQRYSRYLPIITSTSASKSAATAKMFFGYPKRKTEAYETLKSAYLMLVKSSPYFKAENAKYPDCVAVLETEFKDLLSVALQSCEMRTPDQFALNGLLSIVSQCKNSIEESDTQALDALNQIEDILNEVVHLSQEFLSSIVEDEESVMIDNCCQLLSNVQSMLSQVVFSL